MRKTLFAVVVSLVLATASLPSPAAEPPAGGSTASSPPREPVVLNEQAYIRQVAVFGLERLAARPLREDAERFFPKATGGAAELSRLERNTRKLLAGKEIDWDKTDWRDVAVYHWSRTQCGVDERGAMMLPTLWPAANWAAADFDDSAWSCERMGRLSPGRLGTSAYNMNSLMFRGVYYRTCFTVPDPEKAGDLTVSIRYRGGARILINGTEIARGSLPAGELDEQTHAEDYPFEAYTAADDEIRADVPDQKRDCSQGIADLRTDWEEARVSSRRGEEVFRANCMAQQLNEKGWRRIQGLRDRAIGPVKVPAKLLRKGVNVLAIETRTSFLHAWTIPTPRERRWGVHGGYTNLSWDHCGLVRVEMRSADGSVPSVLTRPAGVQAWVADMHRRLWQPDSKPLSAGQEVLRFVGARNGSFSGQIGITTDRELTGLKATAGKLAAEHGHANGGVAMPPSLKVMPMRPQPIWALNYLGEGRSEGVGYNPGNPRMNASTGELALHRYQVMEGLPRERDGRIDEKTVAKAYDDFKFFDHISAAWPEKVPAGTCQPLWVYLSVPADAAEGVYKGKVTIQADGVEPITVPVQAEVVGWRLPGPKDFQTIVQSEQSPYGVANQYKVPLWSDEHFRLMETSFKQLARLGVSWAYVSVLTKSELGNRDDVMIKWTRKKDGSLSFDYSIMDRYLALAGKHFGTPKVVCFLVMHGTFANSTAVPITDEATGKTELVEVGPDQDATRRPLWRAFAGSLYEHMKGLGLEKSMYYGQAFDDVPDKSLVTLLAEATPGVYWTGAAHGRGPDATFRISSRAYGVDLGSSSLLGWKTPFVHMLMPRMAGSVICVEGTTTPYTHRVMVDRGLYSGFNGVGRMGADWFNATWFSGFSGGQWNMVGRSCVQTLWPGTDGPEASARHEAMLEGVQEGEARIFIEQALDRKVLPEVLATEVQAVLNRHCYETFYIPGGAADPYLMDYITDWQGRSRRLFAAAAKVANQVGLDVDQVSFGEMLDKVAVPTGMKAKITVRLRNWTDKPRTWKAAGSEPWIAPEKAEGTVTGRQDMAIVLDGTALTDGAEVTGKVTITDVASGTSYPVTVAAKVVKGLELMLRREIEFVSGGGSGSEGPKLIHAAIEPVFNCPVGGSDAREFFLVNRSAEQLSWTLASDAAWLKLEPAGGQIAPDSSVKVKVTAAPPDKTGALHEPAITVSAAGGKVKDSGTIKVYVIPPYVRPAVPAGGGVYLNDLDQDKTVKRHVYAGFTRGVRRQRPWTIPEDPRPLYQLGHQEPPVTATTPYTMGKKTFTRGLWVAPTHETVYDISGLGFTAFAAEVGFLDGLGKKNRYANMGAVVSFEVYVDGKLAAQSGLMKVGDDPRLLVVDGLAGAKTVTLATRRDDRVDDWYTSATWGDPRFIK